jgi:hypothetical protein
MAPEHRHVAPCPWPLRHSLRVLTSLPTPLQRIGLIPIASATYSHDIVRCLAFDRIESDWIAGNIIAKSQRSWQRAVLSKIVASLVVFATILSSQLTYQLSPWGMNSNGGRLFNQVDVATAAVITETQA